MMFLENIVNNINDTLYVIFWGVTYLVFYRIVWIQ